MLIIENNIIKLSKGDDASLAVNLRSANNTEYEMIEGDMLTMTVRSRPSINAPTILMVTSTTPQINISHDDTKNVKVGQYSADIQLTTADGHIYTIFPVKLSDENMRSETNWKNFWIIPEVSR